MGLFGSGLSSADKQYNWALQDYSRNQMQQNQNLANAAGNYVGLTPASDIAYDTASGGFLNANPYINQVANNVQQGIVDRYNRSYIPQALSSYAGSGRFGGGLFQRTLADTQSQLNTDIGTAMNNLYYANYSTERQMQEQARNRIASQYDPLNRYSSYSGIVNAYTPAQPMASMSSGRGWGQLLGTALGAGLGAFGGAGGVSAGARLGGGLGGLFD